MADDREERIRKRAYDKWQDAGAQHGEHEAHWQQAEREIDEEMRNESGTEKPEPEIHAGDEGGAGLGGGEVTGAVGSAPDGARGPGEAADPGGASGGEPGTDASAGAGKAVRGKGTRKPAGSGRSAPTGAKAAKPAAKRTSGAAKTTAPRKPRAKKAAPPDES